MNHMKLKLRKDEILAAIDDAFRELESQKYALDQSAIVAITDVRGDIIYVNEKFCDISQYSESELIGNNHRIINSGHHTKKFFETMWSTIGSGDVWRGEIKNKAKDGSYYWVDTTITPFLNELDKPKLFVSIRFDISKQKQLESELEGKLLENNSMLSQLSVKNSQLVDFCYIITHDLRTPLSNLGMLCNLVDKNSSKAEMQEIFEKLHKVSDYLFETLEILINSLQIASGQNVECDELELSAVFGKVMDSLQGDLIESDAKINVNFSQINHVHYPHQYLNSIFLNLLSNSIKYRSRERPLKVHVESKLDGAWVQINYKDNGLGLDVEQLKDSMFKFKKIFHAHPQAKGIGLYLLKSQIESMGGSVEVSGAVDQGLSYQINLIENI